MAARSSRKRTRRLSGRGKRKVLPEKRNVTDSDYHKMCKSLAHIEKELKNAKTENAKLRDDNAKLQESQLKLEQSFKETANNLKTKLESKDNYTANLTRRCTKLKFDLCCAEANLKQEKATRRENEELKKRVSELECALAARRHEVTSLEEKLNDNRLLSEKLSNECDAEAKKALIAEEKIDQLEGQLKEANDQLLDNFKSPVLSVSAVSSSDFVCIRQSYGDTTGEEK